MAAAQHGRLWAPAWTVWGAIAATLLLGQARWAGAEGPWLTGEPLRKALAQKVTVVWSNIPVRQAIEGLSKSQKVAILLDRRIDPDRKIELTLDNATLADGLQQIAASMRRHNDAGSRGLCWPEFDRGKTAHGGSIAAGRCEQASASDSNPLDRPTALEVARSGVRPAIYSAIWQRKTA